MFEVGIITGQRAVTAAGTPEKIKEAFEQERNKVIAIRIRAKTGNAGDVYITNGNQRAAASTAGEILAPGELWTFDIHDFLDAYLDLSRVWIDAANNGDAVSYTAVEVL